MFLIMDLLQGGCQDFDLILCNCMRKNFFPHFCGSLLLGVLRLRCFTLITNLINKNLDIETFSETYRVRNFMWQHVVYNKTLLLQHLRNESTVISRYTIVCMLNMFLIADFWYLLAIKRPQNLRGLSRFLFFAESLFKLNH